MFRTVRYADTPAAERRAAADAYARRVDRTPGVNPAARAAYKFIVERADRGLLTGVDDLADRFGVSERTAYRWMSDLGRLDVLRAG